MMGEQQVEITGWIDNKRSSGKIAFLQVRLDGRTVQAVAGRNDRAGGFLLRPAGRDQLHGHRLERADADQDRLRLEHVTHVRRRPRFLCETTANQGNASATITHATARAARIERLLDRIGKPGTSLRQRLHSL